MSKVIVDDIVYDSGSEPDLGSIVCIDSYGNDNMTRHYRCLEEDVETLQSTVTYVRTGSSCFVIDTCELYMFEETGGEWIQVV